MRRKNLKTNKSEKFKLLLIFFVFFLIIITSFSYAEKGKSIMLNLNYEPHYVLTARGDRARRLNNFSESFSFYQHSVAINPENPYPYFWMAYMYNEDKLYIPALIELNNAKKHKENLEQDIYDLYNIYILESYIHYNNKDIFKAKTILLNEILSSQFINRFSPVFTNLNFINSPSKKLLPLLGDTYIIMLYILYNDNRLNLEEDIENNINIQKLIEANYKSDLISYLVVSSDKNKSKYFTRKYENILILNHKEKYKNDFYQKYINNPYLIHDFDNY